MGNNSYTSTQNNNSNVHQEWQLFPKKGNEAKKVFKGKKIQFAFQMQILIEERMYSTMMDA